MGQAQNFSKRKEVHLELCSGEVARSTLQAVSEHLKEHISRNQHACEANLAHFIYNYFKAEPLSGELIVQFLKEKVDIYNLLHSIENHPDNTVVIYFTFLQKIFYILKCYLYQCILTS